MYYIDSVWGYVVMIYANNYIPICKEDMDL